MYGTRACGRGRSWIHPYRRVLLHAALVTAGAALLALSARLAIPLPFSPVPITGQTLAVLALAGLLGRRGAASPALYVGAGVAGLPILAGNVGGWARLAGPTGGYLLGFVVAAYVAGWLSERSNGHPLRLLVALLCGQALIYLCGLVWLRHFVAPERVLAAGLYPFLVGDALKVALSFLLVAPVRWIRCRPS